MVENTYIGKNPKGATELIEKFNSNPDSTSGIVTVPSTIAVGETVTIPAGRTAVLPNMVVDGTLVVDGEVFVPSGSGITTTTMDVSTIYENGKRVVTEDTTAYDVGTSTFIANTLASGAIIERGSNANGEYVKYADGTLVASKKSTIFGDNSVVKTFTITLPIAFISNVHPMISAYGIGSYANGTLNGTWIGHSTSVINVSLTFQGSVTTVDVINYQYIAIGRWK